MSLQFMELLIRKACCLDASLSLWLEAGPYNMCFHIHVVCVCLVYVLFRSLFFFIYSLTHHEEEVWPCGTRFKIGNSKI